jgi:hypothetical protein
LISPSFMIRSTQADSGQWTANAGNGGKAIRKPVSRFIFFWPLATDH